MRANVGVITAALLFCLVGGHQVLSERIPQANGTGWDGTIYAALIKDFEGALSEGRVDSPKASRLLPAYVLSRALILLRLPPTDAPVVALCVAWNVLMLGLLLWGGLRVADALRLTPWGTAALLCAFTLNYATVKMAGYYPVLFDTTAMALMAWLLDAHLRGRLWAVFALGAAGAMCWPSMILVSLPMLLLGGMRAEDTSGRPTWWGRTLAGVVAITAAAVYLGYVWLSRDAMLGRFREWEAGGLITPPLRGWTRVSAVVNAVGLAAACYAIGVAALGCLRPRLGGRFIQRVTLAALLFCVPLAVGALLRPYLAPGYSAGLFLFDLTAFGLIRPLGQLVAHGAYFGPAALFIVCLWGPITRHMGRDLGLLAAAGVAVVFSSNSESRHLVQLFVLLAPFAVAVCDREGFWARMLPPFLLASLYFSKGWMAFNVGPEWVARYFRHQGPFMPHAVCLKHARDLALAAAGLLAFLPAALAAGGAAGVPTPARREAA